VKVLLDECVDWRLARDRAGHDVKTARQMGWTTIKNGELLALAGGQLAVPGFLPDRGYRVSRENEPPCRSQTVGAKAGSSH
jgi:hypothetical protein